MDEEREPIPLNPSNEAFRQPSGGLPFNDRTRLEVSGIFSGTSRVSSRLKRKLAQMAPSDNSGKGVAVVAEFGGPTVAVAAKEASDGR